PRLTRGEVGQGFDLVAVERIRLGRPVEIGRCLEVVRVPSERVGWVDLGHNPTSSARTTSADSQPVSSTWTSLYRSTTCRSYRPYLMPCSPQTATNRIG